MLNSFVKERACLVFSTPFFRSAMQRSFSTPTRSMASQQRVLIIGGCGFVGTSLSRHLASQSHLICIVDLFIPSQLQNDQTRIQFCQADISQLSQLEIVFSNFKPNIVVHLASWGMSGSPMLDPRCHQINVEGTRNSITLCQRYDVKGFIYTSTYNVIFGGQEIVNGDESLPYFPLTDHPDQYGPSKTVAEQLALSANGTKTSNGSTLVSCSLRPAAIYGPEEQRHFPRIVSIMDR
jgi:nucleoside-diphosphate-sugar epimerase